jgi:CubicO group peptidase (beta-lactamase class C family)
VLVERLSQQSLPAFIAERIFRPLNMTSSSYSRTSAEASGHASQAFDEEHRRVPHTTSEADMPIEAGMGGILSTAPDMLRWARFLLAGVEETKAESIVPRAVLEECMSPQVLIRGHGPAKPGRSRITYGFGWQQDQLFGVRVSYPVNFFFCMLNETSV